MATAEWIQKNILPCPGARFVPALDRTTYDNPAVFYETRSRFFVEMSPRYFLLLAGEDPYASDFPELDRESLSDLREKMCRGHPLDPPFIDVDPDTGAIVAHEGRHRSMVAARLGIPKLLVIVFVRERSELNGREVLVEATPERVNRVMAHLDPRSLAALGSRTNWGIVSRRPEYDSIRW